jgi:hypothetical protein
MVKMKRTNLNFYDNVKPLSITEYKFWRKLLPKVLKIGAELEFNLKRTSGNCKGYRTSCICEKYVGAIVNNSCGHQCIFLDKEENKCALNIQSRFNCANNTSICQNSNCHICDKFELNCCPNQCTNYTSKCLLCDTIRTKCLTCPDRYNPSKTPDRIRQDAGIQLEATQNFGFVGETGVLQVVADGSLLNRGLEIPTVGRRLDFETFKNMFKTIIDVAKTSGGYVDDRCSFHIHILNEYYTKVNNRNGASRHPDSDSHLNFTSFEKNMSNIVLTNILQLWRKYELSFFWLSCGLPYEDKITRWEKFRISMLPYSPILMSFQEIKQSLYNKVGKNRYGSLNIANTKTDGSRLHLEFRVCDMILSPSYMAAMCTLFYALILKAVDISCCGLLNVEDKEWIRKETTIKNSFVNGADREYGPNRSSDSSTLYKHKDYLISKTNELLDMLSPILAGFEPAETVLRKVANKPVAFRLLDIMHLYSGDKEIQAMNKYNIENELCEKETQLDIISTSLLKTIALGKVRQCNTAADWVTEISQEQNIPSITIEEHINLLSSDGTIYWNKNIGSYLYR